MRSRSRRLTLACFSSTWREIRTCSYATRARSRRRGRWRNEGRNRLTERRRRDRRLSFPSPRANSPPYAEVEVEWRSCRPRPVRTGATSCASRAAGGSASSPRAPTSSSPSARYPPPRLTSGLCYVNVPVEREIVVQNMTMLPAVFRWSPEPEGESEECADSMDFDVDWREDEIPPGGSKAVRFIFTPLRPCARLRGSGRDGRRRRGETVGFRAHRRRQGSERGVRGVAGFERRARGR